MGDSTIDIYDLDILVPVDMPILERGQSEPPEETLKIGEYIAALVEDGSTVEFGSSKANVPGGAVATIWAE